MSAHREFATLMRIVNSRVPGSYLDAQAQENFCEATIPCKRGTMRYVVAIVLVVILVVIDQTRFNGRYRAQLSQMIERAISSVTR